MKTKIDNLSQKVVDLTTSVDALTKEDPELKQMLQAFAKDDRQKNAGLIAISIGLFSSNLSPCREVMPFGNIDSRRKGPNGEDIYRAGVILWTHLKLLCDKVLRDMDEDSMSEDVFEGCKSNVDSKMISTVVATVKNDPNNAYDINNETTWAKTDPRVQMQAILMLEAGDSPFIPLCSCIRYWGAD